MGSRRKPTLASHQAIVIKDGNQPATTTRIIARVLGKAHKNVLTDVLRVREKIGEERFSRLKIKPREYIDGRGKRQTEFVLSQEAFANLVLGFTGKRAAVMRYDFIQAFALLSRTPEVTPQRIAERRDASADHLAMCDALKLQRMVKGKETSDFHYVNESRLVHYAFGGAFERATLNAEQLATLSAIERFNTKLIRMGLDYAERKEAVWVRFNAPRITQKEAPVTTRG